MVRFISPSTDNLRIEFVERLYPRVVNVLSKSAGEVVFAGMVISVPPMGKLL
jgi:hypothetical protein